MRRILLRSGRVFWRFSASAYAALLLAGFTWSIVHCFGFLSGRQRRNLVPWRKRPPEKWSYWNSPTRRSLSGTHSVSRSSRVHRLGPPGALPVKPPASAVAVISLPFLAGPAISGLRIGFSFLRSSRLKLELKPT